MRRVALVCADTVGERMAGPAIRAVELGRALAEADDLDVVVAARCTGESPPMGRARLVALGGPRDPQVRELAGASDVLIVQGDVLVRWPQLRRARGALIADLYCPIPLETIEQTLDRDMQQRIVANMHAVSVLDDQLLCADHFICASERQLDLWIGALMALGRINPQRFPDAGSSAWSSLFTIVPFGVPEHAFEKSGAPLRERFGIDAGEQVLLWGGGVYEWFDPHTVVRAVGDLDRRGERVHLVFLGGPHPSDGGSHARRMSAVRDLATSLGLAGRAVHFNDQWIPYGEHQAYFADADIGVIAHRDTLETRYAYRTRVVDYLAAGLPLITTAGDYFADEAVARGFGKVVPYGDVSGWCRAIRELRHEDARRACAAAARAFAATSTWRHLAAPLARVCREVVPAADRTIARTGPFADVLRRHQSLLLRARRTFRAGGIRAVASAAKRRLLGT